MQKRRNLELDLFKLLLVVGMIAAHVFQLLHNGKSNGSMIWMFSTYINAITFSGFLLAFGCATQLAYLRKTKDKILRGKLMRNGIRLLIAFYISGLAYTFFVSHNLGMMETIKILCLTANTRLFGVPFELCYAYAYGLGSISTIKYGM